MKPINLSKREFAILVDAYLECAAWSSTDDEGESLEGYGFSDAARAQAQSDCEDFANEAYKYLHGLEAFEIGHYFWLTRNGHGTGFWDRCEGTQGDELTRIAKSFGSVDVYLADPATEILDFA